jgi:hypothetical protein
LCATARNCWPLLTSDRDATAASLARTVVPRGTFRTRMLPIPAYCRSRLLAGLDVVPSDEPAMLDSVLVVGFFAAVVVAGFVVEAMASRCATVTVPPVGVLVFEAVPVVGRYRPPPTYIVAIALLLNRDCQCADRPRR